MNSSMLLIKSVTFFTYDLNSLHLNENKDQQIQKFRLPNNQPKELTVYLGYKAFIFL